MMSVKKVKSLKKALLFMSITIILFFSFSVTAFSIDSNIDTYNKEFEFEKITDSISNETAGILSEMGIDSISFENLYNTDIKRVINCLFEIGGNAFKEPAVFFISAVGIMAITSVIMSFTGDSTTVRLIGDSVVALCACVPVSKVVLNSFSVLETLNVFTVSFAGVFCAIVSSSGNVSLGTSYASLAVLSDSLFSALLSGVSKPAINAMCCMSFLSCFDIYDFSIKLSKTVKTIYISFLGFVATFFSGIVTLKGVLGAGADSLTARGVKFVVGKTLPIVGGAVSESYSALISSLSLIRNTVGVFGIVTVVVTVLPTLLQIGGWIIALMLAINIAELSGVEKASGMLSVLKDSLVLLGATIIFSAVIFVVFVGVVIFIKGV